MKILIVEDNEDERRLLNINLHHHGWNVLEASNGMEAMEIIEKQKPDIIVSDILMPKMDGFELIWNLKQKEDAKNIPFIFYSAIYTGEKDKILAMALGAEAFIEKPKEPEKLFEIIKDIYVSTKKDNTVKLPDMRLIMEEGDFLKAYSHIVASKLDQKVRELENINKKYSELYNEYQTLLDSIPDIICLIDENLKIKWINKSFEIYFNSDREKVIDMNCYIFLYNKEKPCEICPAKKAFETGIIELQECQIKNGKTWEIRAIPVKDKEGKVFNVIEIIRDITDQKKTQQHLYHAQKMEDIGILAGGIAHDFRNMLTPIIGFAQLIKLAVDKESPLYNYAENILNAGEKASNLAQGLLAFSRKQLLDMKPVIIDDLILSFLKLIARIIGEDIELRINLNADKHSAMADMTQLQQVLMNLITNARDAMPRGGILSISTEIINIDEYFIKTHGFGNIGKYILITISDTGIGMDDSTKSKIFEPFFTTKPVGKGTGLGLAIVYGIVRQHGGHINVYSELGVGSTFRIYIPAIDVKAEIEKQKSISEDSFDTIVGNGEVILLIEDDENVRNYIKTVLEEVNYRVIEAKNGQEGIDKFIENIEIIQLILLDLIMPTKNGKEIMEEIQKINSRIKHIFMSGYTSDIIFERGIIDKEIEYLAKPISPINLLQKVKEVLSKR